MLLSEISELCQVLYISTQETNWNENKRPLKDMKDQKLSIDKNSFIYLDEYI